MLGNEAIARGAYEAGVRVVSSYPGTPSTEITEYSMLESLLQKCKPGDQVSVKIYRSGRYYSTTVTIGSNNAVG